MIRIESTKELSYLQSINTLLRPKTGAGIHVVDLFCGCGGLSLGFEAAGFTTQGYDASPDAIATSRSNLTGSSHLKWMDQEFLCPNTEVIIGGPPCQPFSEIGLRKGFKDMRNGFPVFLNAIQTVRPEIWMFENVPGLASAQGYLDEIIKSLKTLGYKVEKQIIDASHFGVPQRRRRLVVVGWKHGKFSWPTPTSTNRVVGDAIGRLMKRSSSDSKFLTPSMENYIAKYELASKCINPRDLDPSKPSRTVTCRNLAGATGDMLRVALPDGRRRMLTIKEASRLQSFPDWFRFKGSEASRFTQIGNAVPPLLSLHLGYAFRQHLS